MRKTALIFAAVLSLILACAAVPAMAVDSTAQTETPKLVPATVRGDNIPVILFFLSRGDMVEVAGYEDETHAIVKTEQGTGSVDIQFLRFPGEEQKSKTIFAQGDAALYPRFDCQGKPIRLLKLNEKLEALEELNNCYFVQIGDETGFVKKQQTGTSAYTPRQPSGQDGGDITMAFSGRICFLTDVQLEPQLGQATVKVSGVPVVRRYCNAGEQVQILAEERIMEEVEGYLPILDDDVYAYIPQSWVQQEGEPDFRQWEGYAGQGCKLYSDYLFSGADGKNLKANSKLTVLWDNGDVAFVRTDDGFGFVSSITLRTTPAASGGSSGSSEWTPPAL